MKIKTSASFKELIKFSYIETIIVLHAWCNINRFSL